MEWNAVIPGLFDLHSFKLYIDSIDDGKASGCIISRYSKIYYRFSNYRGLNNAVNALLDKLKYPSPGTLADYETQQLAIPPQVIFGEWSLQFGKIGSAYVYVYSRDAGNFSGRLLTMYKDCSDNGGVSCKPGRLRRYACQDFKDAKELERFIQMSWA